MPPKKGMKQEQKNCILSQLKDWKVVGGITSASDSIFVTGFLDGQEVFVKFGLTSQADDNSLEFERKTYMFINEFLKQRTPHLLPGITEGSCFIKDFPIMSKTAYKSSYDDFINVFVALVNPEIELTLQEETSDNEDEGDLQDEKDYTFEEILELVKEKPLDIYQKVYYIVTPKLKGSPLSDFVTNPKNKSIIALEDFQLQVACQVAQALSILADEKMMHNDLHSQNIYISNEPNTVLSYDYNVKDNNGDKYNMKFKLKTNWKVTIFDFDRAHRPSWTNLALKGELCDEVGECDQYEPNMDWYTFLTYFIGLLEQQGVHTSLRSLVYGGGTYGDIKVNNYQPKVGKDAVLGKACMCESTIDIRRGDEILMKCKKCKKNVNRLHQMMKPSQFVNQYITEPSYFRDEVAMYA